MGIYRRRAPKFRSKLTPKTSSLGAGRAQKFRSERKRAHRGHRGREVLEQPASSRAGCDRLLAATIGLAAAFHDLGKLSAGFQDVLMASARGGSVPWQPVRHELISLAILRRSIDLSQASGDREYLEALACDPRAVIRAGFANLASVLRGSLAYQGDSGVSIDHLLPSRDDFPVLRAVADLVMTHHRLPQGVHVPGRPAGPGRPARPASFGIVDVHHWNRGNTSDRMLPIDRFLISARGADIALEDPLWSTPVVKDAKEAMAIIASGVDVHGTAWGGAAYSIGRLSLMLGDHQASMAKRAFPLSAVELWDANLCFANTKRAAPRDEWDDNPGRTLADPWQIHTHKVRRRARLIYDTLMLKGDAWPGIRRQDLPDRILDAEASETFAWQTRVADAINDRRRTAGGTRPTLSFVMASTGTGKTVAVPKMAAALTGDGDLRLNVCLGLRSLTLQTGDEYRERIGLRADQATVVIGSTTAQKLHEASRRQADIGEIQIEDTDISALPGDVGTSALVEMAQDILHGGDVLRALPRIAERVIAADLRPETRRRMLATPILVCTIDTLMRVAGSVGGGHLGDQLRLASADLIIDEIDSYGPEDLTAICRIIRIAASFGRNVIVSSATLRRSHAETIRCAYAAGRQEFCGLREIPTDFDICWASEFLVEIYEDDCYAGGNQTADRFISVHRAIAERIVDKLQDAPVRRRAVVLTEEHNAPTAAYSAALALHDDNSLVDPQTGIRVSVGIVRWNRVKSARKFTEDLAAFEPPPAYEFAFVCYHSKFTLAVRHQIYERIATMCARKQRGGEDPLFSNPDIRRHLARTAAAGKSELVCFISTTNIIEVGCDLDVDWAVTEPCSSHSMAQLGGRVRRHRQGEHAPVNTALLSSPVLGEGAKRSGMGNPGSESSVVFSMSGKDAKVHHPVRRTGPDAKIMAEEVFPVHRWIERVDAGTCLIDMPSSADDAEVGILDAICLGKSEPSKRLIKTYDWKQFPVSPGDIQVLRSMSSVAYFADPTIQFTDFAQVWRRFRREDPAFENIEVRLEEGLWWMRDGQTRSKDDRNAGWFPAGGRVEPLLGDPDMVERLLFPREIFEVEVSAAMLEEILDVDDGPVGDVIRRELRSVSLLVSRRSDEGSRIFYSPFLGGDDIFERDAIARAA